MPPLPACGLRMCTCGLRSRRRKPRGGWVPTDRTGPLVLPREQVCRRRLALCFCLFQLGVKYAGEETDHGDHFYPHMIAHPISSPLHLVTLEFCPREHLLPTPTPIPAQAPASLLPVPMKVAAPGPSHEWGHTALFLCNWLISLRVLSSRLAREDVAGGRIPSLSSAQ